MQNRSKPIPVNAQSAGTGDRIFINRTTYNGTPGVKEVERAHRDDWHLFLLQEQGTTSIEIDFEQRLIGPGAALYIHPTQVHRLIGFKDATISTWMADTDQLRPEYLNLLEELAPTNVLSLSGETRSILSEAVSLALRISGRENKKLHSMLLHDSCNTLTGLLIAEYLTQSAGSSKITRYEAIAKSFRTALERHFETVKSPGEYARLLHVSVPYLNECVRKATGHSVSYQIHNRVILEAKRLLYHSGKSVKEIASGLGYDDYSYFTRLFTRINGMTPSAFRKKNLGLS